MKKCDRRCGKFLWQCRDMPCGLGCDAEFSARNSWRTICLHEIFRNLQS